MPARERLPPTITLGMPVKGALTKADTTYTVTADLGGFAADKLVMNQKLEANTLKVVANNAGYQVKGDVKINGQPASLDYRKPNEGDADIKLQATLDDASRARLGLDLGSGRQRRDSDQGDRQDRRSRQPRRHRGRSHLAEARQHPAGLGQGARQVGQGDVQRGEEGAIDAVPGHRGRRRRRLDQGIAGSRPERRSVERELPDLFAVGRRQDLAEGRARRRRRRQGHDARRRVRRPRLPQIGDLGQGGRPQEQDQEHRLRHRPQARRGRGLQWRGVAQRRQQVFPAQRHHQELYADRQGRTRYAGDRGFARPRAGAGPRRDHPADQRRRRVPPLHRHLFQDDRRPARAGAWSRRRSNPAPRKA